MTAPSSTAPGKSRRRRTTALGHLYTRIFPPLSFDQPLESRFRSWYAEHVHARIRNAMWIPMLALLVAMFVGGPVRELRDTIFGAHNDRIVDLLRFWLIAPSCLAMLLVTYTRLYHRWFSLTAQIVAPIHAMSFVAIDILMNTQGYSFSALMPLVVLGPYFLFGMLQAQAVRTVVMIVVAYAIGGYLAGLTGGQRMFDLSVLIFASCLGAAIHYSLQKSLRHNYLSTQLMNESLNRDALTGIHNRRMFDEHAARVWQQATRAGVPVALLMIDIDHFKAFNDRGGHQAGDACLIKVAGLLNRASRRPLDLAARYGGEEFVILLYDAQRERVEDLCRQLHADLAALAIEHPAFDAEHVTFSIGAACVEPQPGRRVEGLIQLADEALYTAKERGRNRTVVMDREYASLNTGAFRVRRKNENVVA